MTIKWKSNFYIPFYFVLCAKAHCYAFPSCQSLVSALYVPQCLKIVLVIVLVIESLLKPENQAE
jgi:F0F1-type ATP synthase assembly protein I